MNKEQLTLRVIQIVKEITQAKDVDAFSTVHNLPNWDSLAYMTVVAAVEDEFKIQVNQDNVTEFDSIEKIVKMLS
ncbi:MAG: acyl carrier protein [Candidatus Puniceispirillaceae bacterium]